MGSGPGWKAGTGARTVRGEERKNQKGQEEFRTNQSPQVRSWTSQQTSLGKPHWKASRQWQRHLRVEKRNRYI